MAHEGKRHFFGIRRRPIGFEDPYSNVANLEIAQRLGLRNIPPDPEDIAAYDQHENALRRAARERKVASEKARYSTFGLVAKPEEDTLWGYKYTLRHNSDLKFSATNYGLFDGLITKACGVDDQGRSTHAAFNPNHDFHEDYAPLRRNIAILRNYLLTKYPPEGKDAQANIEKVRAMGDELGKALAGSAGDTFLIERWFGTLANLFTGQNLSKPHVGKFMRLANTPDRGAAFMYEYLHRVEHRNPLNNFSSTRHWKLEALDNTPFSAHNIEHDSRSSNMWRVTEGFDLVTHQLRSVDELSKVNKEMSVEEAHKILENLRINIAADQDKKVDVQDPVVHEARGLLTTVIAYRDALATLVRYDPNLLLNPDIVKANEAIEHLSYKMKEEEKEMLKQEERPELAHVMQGRIKQTPTKQKSKQSTKQLLARIDLGFKHLDKIEKSMRVKMSTKAQKAMGAAPSVKGMDVSRVREGMNGTMASPKITQVSDKGFVGVAQKMNAFEPELQAQKDNSGNVRGK